MAPSVLQVTQGIAMYAPLRRCGSRPAKLIGRSMIEFQGSYRGRPAASRVGRAMIQCSQEYNAVASLTARSAATGEQVSLSNLFGKADQKALVSFLTVFGDFDSFEICQRLNPYMDSLERAGVDVVMVGIGSRDAAIKFSELTGFPKENIYADDTASAHAALGFEPGFARASPTSPQHWWTSDWLVERANAINLHPYWKLVIMCAGVGSPGTLKEVFRGYLGDKEAPEAAQRYPGVVPSMLSKLFRTVGDGYQRPFELATVRLINMGNILFRWDQLVPDDKDLILQRGGALIFQGQEVVYRHDDKGILGYVDVDKYVECALE